MSKLYDCVIIGTGIAGSTSALVLAQTGLRVLAVEAGAHPRFAIGESFLPTTTLGFDYLARTYAIPEFRTISHYPELHEHGLTGWPKLGFWFGNHCAGANLSVGCQMLFVSPGLPIGPDVHVLRADVDSFLVKALPTYGVDYQEHTTVTQFVPQADKVELILEQEGQCSRVSTRFVLDCTGQNSVLAASQGLRQSPPALRTNTRVIFSHFRHVAWLDDILGESRSLFRISRDAGTIHHSFPGGWFWVIRFDNGVTSVGLMLDRSIYPDNDLPAEEEFWSFVRRFPTVYAQFSAAQAVRPYVKTGRVQFNSPIIVGDRFLLTPHAAAFVDPLFSTGVDLTTAFIARAAPLIRRMVTEDDFRAERLICLERWYALEIDTIDLLVHGMYCSFQDIDLLKQFWRCWIFMSLTQYYTQTVCDPLDESGPLGHYAATFPGWRAQLSKMYQCLTAAGQIDPIGKGRDPKQTAGLLKAMMDDFLEPFDGAQTNWALDSAEPCCPTFAYPTAAIEWFQKLLAQEPLLARHARTDGLSERRQRILAENAKLNQHYRKSKAEGAAYHTAVDFIRAQQSS